MEAKLGHWQVSHDIYRTEEYTVEWHEGTERELHMGKRPAARGRATVKLTGSRRSSAEGFAVQMLRTQNGDCFS